MKIDMNEILREITGCYIRKIG